MSNLDLIKSIRARTNLSYKDINKAIDALTSTDENAIIYYLRQQGVLKAQARNDRDTNEGGVFSYVHEGKIGVMVEIKCETDFVSRGDIFKNFGKELTLHIAASQPKFVSEDEVDQDFVAKEIQIARERLINEGKPENMMDKILEGVKSKIVKEFSLLSQPFLINPDITISQLVAQISQQCGEKIEITRFVIYNLNS